MGNWLSGSTFLFHPNQTTTPAYHWALDCLHSTYTHDMFPVPAEKNSKLCHNSERMCQRANHSFAVILVARLLHAAKKKKKAHTYLWHKVNWKQRFLWYSIWPFLFYLAFRILYRAFLKFIFASSVSILHLTWQTIWILKLFSFVECLYLLQKSSPPLLLECFYWLEIGILCKFLAFIFLFKVNKISSTRLLPFYFSLYLQLA